MFRLIVIALALGLAACAASSGVPADGFAYPSIARAYVPLSAPAFLMAKRRGAAVVIARNIAVTNAHNVNLLDPRSVIGTSSAYDLAFFYTDSTATPPLTTQPRLGERVVAYGEGTGGQLRLAHGVVTALDAPVEPRCPSCGAQTAFTFKGDAGEGFSGGPVVDAESGELIGIVFGYEDGQPRTIYAYSTRRVEAELARVETKLPTDVN